MRVVVLSDTHITPAGRRRLPDDVYHALADADAVIHAGDIVTVDLVHELSGFAPVYAVLGNNDGGDLAGLLPETRVEVLDGVRVGMIHDAGPRQGRERRMSRRFPDCAVVVYGHSHVPDRTTGVDGQLLFNPGSPTDKRMQPMATYGVLQLEDGLLREAEIIPLGG